MDIVSRQHIKAVVYLICLMLALLVLLFQFTDAPAGWWWFTFICIIGAVIIGIADICFVYAQHLINNHTEE